MRGETKQLTAEARTVLPGSFIELADGFTHYQLAGPEDAPVVVLVHGFSVPYFIWDPAFEALTAAGYRVLRFDLYGRGFSDRPHSRYDTDLFVRQLKNLLDGLGIEQCRAVFGLSMGGVIVTNFAVRYPERLEKLVLVDPAGFKLDYPGAYKLLSVPLLGELIFSLAGDHVLEQAMATDFHNSQYVQAFLEQYRPQMTYKGFKRAILETIRTGTAEDGLSAYQQLGKLDHPPVLLVWGEQDQTVPFKFHNVLTSLIPRIEFHPIPDAGHVPYYEQPEMVEPIFLEFLNA
ncbi:alpha/beta hydrolase [bacterium]|nr:alpha/beta hydrolase [bacterium]MCB2179418.1 alpha/beta hydrolase [bacterium]